MLNQTIQATDTRQARSAQTRAAIVAAAHDAFINHGYRATSLRDIATAADISHPGLLRHFATKDELLAEVVDEIEAENDRLLDQADPASELGARWALMAQLNAEVPGYLALFAALTGEASTRSHPAHERMRTRSARLIAITADAFEEAIRQNGVAADRDPQGEAVRLSAAWAGLQVIAQYLPDRVDVPKALQTHADLLAQPIGWRRPGDLPESSPASVTVPPPFTPSEEAPSGYRAGRERRARIVDDAMTLFAQEGFGDTSLREVAEKVGVSKSTLLHHYPSKDLLLSAVLAARDRRAAAFARPAPVARSRDVLRNLPLGAAANLATEPGLIEVYAVLTCEAVPPEHPAHAHFTRRFGMAIDQFSALFRAAQADGDLPAHRDPEFEALWLTALWDGLQYLWLYDHDSVDIAAHLAAHLDDVLPLGPSEPG